MLERASGLRMGDAESGFLLAFSPERVYSGRVLLDLATYPKLVGGIDRESTERAANFYRNVLEADVWELSRAESAEFAKLAETTYRDVNIALANQFARYAEEAGVDVVESIRGANSQPYSHIHQPGMGVGGHCIPVYPHFLLARAPGMALVRQAREINDGQVEHCLTRIEAASGELFGREVLVLGLTYREGVKELAYSRAIALIQELRDRGAHVSAYDPLLSRIEVESSGAIPYCWGTRSSATVVIAHTADPIWATLSVRLFPRLELLFDARNAMRSIALPDNVHYLAIGMGSYRTRNALPLHGNELE
jgi:nucleotide sugar dehydrogenase